MKKLVAVTVGLLISVSAVGVAWAERWVVVNGTRLTIPQIQYLEQVACGPIPNGNYWLNIHTGVWGYANNPVPQGQITGNCGGGGYGGRRPSLSERGMLYSPYDWVR